MPAPLLTISPDKSKPSLPIYYQLKPYQGQSKQALFSILALGKTVQVDTEREAHSIMTLAWLNKTSLSRRKQPDGSYHVFLPT